MIDTVDTPIRVRARDYEPAPGNQTKVLQRSERELFTGGSRGGGKTDIGLAWLAEPEYANHPQYQSLVVRKDYEDLQQWIIRARAFYQGLAIISGTPAKVHWNAGGVTDIGHWKDEDTLSKYIGNEYHKQLHEEITQTIATLQEYKMLLGSLRSSVPGLRSQLMANGNPGGKGHSWVKAYFVDKCRVSACCGAALKRGETGDPVCIKCDKPAGIKLQTYLDPVSKSSRIFIPLSYKDNPYLEKNDPEYLAYLLGLEGALGRAWRDGDWDAFKGQFFSNFGPHLKEKPFHLRPAYHRDRVFGSFDFGCGLNGVSSFNYWFVDEKDVPHLCFTHTSRGLIAASEQAQILEDYISSFTETEGMMPRKIWYDNSMNSKAGDADQWATVDYFKEVFDRHDVEWIPANKSRINGWRTMLDYFAMDAETECAKFKYWDGYNDDFVNTVPYLQSDPNRPEDVEKCDIDHWAESGRYGLVGIRTLNGEMTGHSKNRTRNIESLESTLDRMVKAGRVSDSGLN
jgi:hypothetical protein